MRLYSHVFLVFFSRKTKSLCRQELRRGHQNKPSLIYLSDAFRLQHNHLLTFFKTTCAQSVTRVINVRITKLGIALQPSFLFVKGVRLDVVFIKDRFQCLGFQLLFTFLQFWLQIKRKKVTNKQIKIKTKGKKYRKYSACREKWLGSPRVTVSCGGQRLKKFTTKKFVPWGQ